MLTYVITHSPLSQLRALKGMCLQVTFMARCRLLVAELEPELRSPDFRCHWLLLSFVFYLLPLFSLVQYRCALV